MKEWLIYHPEPITLTTGGRSHWFVDAKAIFEDEHLRQQVLVVWERKLPNYGQNWHLIGVPEGGMRWAAALAGYLYKKRGILATLGRPEYTIPEDFSVAVVEDVVTTGASLYAVVPKNKVAETLCVVLRNPDMYVGSAWATIDLREENWQLE